MQLARLCTAQVFQYSSHQSSRVVPSQGVSQQMAVTCLRKGLLVVCPEPRPGLTGAGGQAARMTQSGERHFRAALPPSDSS